MAIDKELEQRLLKKREEKLSEKSLTVTDVYQKNTFQADDKFIQELEPIEVDNPLAYAFKLGILDTYRGVKQMTGADKEQLKAEQQKLNELMRGKDGGKVAAAYFAGAIVDPAGWLIPFGKARTLYKMGKYGMVSGAIAGATGYVDTEEGLFKTRTSQAFAGALGGGIISPAIGGLKNLGVRLTGKGNMIPLTAKKINLTPAESIDKGLNQVQAYGKLDPTEEILETREVGKVFTEGERTLTKRPDEDIGVELPSVFETLVNIFRKTPVGKRFPETEVIPDRPTPGQFTGFYNLKRKATGFLDDVFANYEKKIGSRILEGVKTGEGAGAVGGTLVGFNIERDEPLSTRLGLALAGGISGLLVGKSVKKIPFGDRKVKYVDDEGKEQTVIIKQKLSDVIGRLFIDKYGLSTDYKVLLNKYDGTQNSIAGNFVRVAKKMQELTEEERKILYNMLEGDNIYPVSSPVLTKLKDEARDLIDTMGQRYVDLGLITEETFKRNKGTYLGRLYTKYADEITKVGDELKPRGLLEEDKYTVEDWFTKLSREKPTIDDKEILSAEGIEHKGWELFGDYAVGIYKTISKTVDAKGNPIPLNKQKKVRQFVEDENGNVIIKVLKRNPPTDVQKNLNQKGDVVKGKLLKPTDTISVRWQYTKPERLYLGEIEDAAIAMEYTGQVMANTIAKYSFFGNLASKYGKVAKGVREEIQKGSNKFYDEITNEDLKAGWRQIPKGIVRGTKVQKFGLLGGKYVPEEVYNDIVVGSRYQQQNSSWFYKNYKKLNSVWKSSKTAWNPTVHVNNVFGNFVLTDLAGVPISTLPEAARALVQHGKKGKTSQLVLDAIEHGVFDADFVRKELKNFRAEDLANVYKAKVGVDGWSNSVSIAKNIYNKVLNNSITGTLENWYRLEDHIFRLNAFAHRIRMGDTFEDAAMFARKNFIDYDIDAPVINWARNTVTPFLAFSYRVIPLLVESAVLRPHKYFKYAALGYGLNKFEELYGGQEAKVERALLPEYEAGNILDLPFMPKKTIRIPVKDENGRPKFLNIQRLFPGGDAFSWSGGNLVPFLPEPLQPSAGLGGDVISSLIGYDLFLQRREPGRGTGSVLEESGLALASLSKKLIPNFPFIPGAYSTQKLERALREEESPYRVPQTEFEALLNSFGFKVSNKSIATLTVRAKADLQKKISLERYKIKIARQRLNNSQITMADYDRILSDKRKKIYDLIEEYKLKLEGFDPYASRIRDDVTGFMGSGDSISDFSLEKKEDKKYKMKEELLRLKQKKEQ